MVIISANIDDIHKIKEKVVHFTTIFKDNLYFNGFTFNGTTKIKNNFYLTINSPRN